jgi:hypothetical protein
VERFCRKWSVFVASGAFLSQVERFCQVEPFQVERFAVSSGAFLALQVERFYIKPLRRKALSAFSRYSC